MENNTKSNSKIIIIALAVLLAGVIGYTFYSNSENKKLTNAIEQEKMEISQNLDSMIVKYEDAIAQKTALSGELAIERDRIIALRDSLKEVKATDYKIMRRYRNQIASLEKANKRLFKMNDSLTGANKVLSRDLSSAHEKILMKVAENDTLTVKNTKLAEKVAIGAALKVNTAKVLAMKQRNSGKLVETSRSRRTDAFRISFTVAKNEIAPKGERQLYIQISDAAGNTIASKGEFTLNDGSQLSYSDTSSIEYANEDLDVISLVEVNRDSINDGVYTVRIFVENKLAGETKITLK